MSQASRSGWTENQFRLSGMFTTSSISPPVSSARTEIRPARMRVVDLVPPLDHLFTVGRLDMSSEGLMLVTNDGDLANHLAHPRYGVEKTYRVTVMGSPDAQALKKLRSGIHPGRRTSAGRRIACKVAVE